MSTAGVQPVEASGATCVCAPPASRFVAKPLAGTPRWHLPTPPAGSCGPTSNRVFNNVALRLISPFVMPAPLATTLERDFPDRDFDFGSEEDRIRLGYGSVIRGRYTR
jgi:hypothetical protein